MSREHNEQEGEPVTSVTLSFEDESVTLAKVGNASLENAFKAVQIVKNATLTLLDQDRAFTEIGLDTNEKLRLLYDYLGVASRKKRRSPDQFELDQVKMMYERLAPRFPEADTSQARDAEGRRGKGINTRKRQTGGFDPNE